MESGRASDRIEEITLLLSMSNEIGIARVEVATIPSHALRSESRAR